MEFALVAAPFFLLLGAIMELAMVFVLDSVLEAATMDTGRMIRTGQADAQGFDAARFKEEVCSRMSV
ncbi:pilus assembly protein, partial [Vibrio vulnificus]|nr:pilus assembly protein [Vibrio vulnificus]